MLSSKRAGYLDSEPACPQIHSLPLCCTALDCRGLTSVNCDTQTHYQLISERLEDREGRNTPGHFSPLSSNSGTSLAGTAPP